MTVKGFNRAENKVRDSKCIMVKLTEYNLHFCLTKTTKSPYPAPAKPPSPLPNHQFLKNKKPPDLQNWRRVTKQISVENIMSIYPNAKCIFNTFGIRYMPTMKTSQWDDVERSLLVAKAYIPFQRKLKAYIPFQPKAPSQWDDGKRNGNLYKFSPISLYYIIC